MILFFGKLASNIEFGSGQVIVSSPRVRWALMAHNPEPGVMKPDRVALRSGRV
jgi:hypothetical protein